MDPTLYFSAFIGFLGICLLATIIWRPAMRACLACGEQTRIDARRCRSCGYMPTSA
jgi:hypothetical protein